MAENNESIPATTAGTQITNKAELQQANKELSLADKAAEAKKRIQENIAKGIGVKPQAPLPSSNILLTSAQIEQSLLTIPSLVEVPDNEYEHVICYGAPGSGKTLEACMLAEFYNILFLDGDKGLKTALTNLPKSLQARIRPIRIPDNTQNPLFWATILKVITGRQIRLCIDHGITDMCPICQASSRPYFTVALNQLPSNWLVVVDSVTQFVASATAAINRKANGGSKDTNDEFKFTFDEWGILRNIVEKFGNYVKDLECNAVFLSHEILAKTEDEKRLKLVPVGGSENASKSFAKYFSTCVYAQVVNSKHVFCSSSTYNSNIQTKSRSNVVLEKEPIPGFIHLFRQDAKELLKGSWTEWYFSDRKKPEPQPKNILSTGV